MQPAEIVLLEIQYQLLPHQPGEGIRSWKVKYKPNDLGFGCADVDGGCREGDDGGCREGDDGGCREGDCTDRAGDSSDWICSATWYCTTVGLFRAFTIACHVGGGLTPFSHSFRTWRKHWEGSPLYLVSMLSRVETRWPNSNPRLYHSVLTT